MIHTDKTRQIYNNFFLTGEKKTGKTTLLQNVLLPFRQRISGFETLPYHTENNEQGYYLHALSADVIKEENDRRISLLSPGRERTVMRDVFDTFGCRYLSASLRDKSELILMDELGTMEEDAEEFRLIVTKCLDCRDKPVVGVIKESPSNWLAAIRNREDTLVLRLTRQNTQDAENRLVVFLRQSCGWPL